MTKKEILKNDILMKMRPHMDANMLSMLDVILSDELYHVDIIDSQTVPATIDMSNEYIVGLFNLKRGQKLSKATMREYMISIRVFLRYINKPLVQVTQEDVEQYLRMKQREGNTATSLNNKRKKLNALFDWMRKSGFIQQNPMDNIEPYPEVMKPVDHLTAEEMEMIKRGCRTKRDRALIEWLRCTATRNGEIPMVNINQIDWDKKKVLIYGEKSRTWRTVCLDGVAIMYLREYIEEERGLTIKSTQPLFTHSRGDTSRHMTRSGIYSAVRRIGARSGLDRRVYPHLFRKTTATNIVRRGGNTDQAGQYLGHRPQGVTGRHYVYNSEEQTIKIFRDYVEAV